MLSKAFWVLLNSDIRKMDKAIVNIVRVENELIRTGSKIPKSTEVNISLWIDKDPDSEVEFAFIYK
jgi:hypothetical protein